jgi:hypothetical protein
MIRLIVLEKTMTGIIKHLKYKKPERLTHGIVHAGFSGLRRFVARKKIGCNLIGFRFVIPHDTIPSTLGHIIKKTPTAIK